MPKQRLQGGSIGASYSVEWQRNVYTQERKAGTKRLIRKREHNYGRDWEVYGNLSTVPGDQPWQEYDY